MSFAIFSHATDAASRVTTLGWFMIITSGIIFAIVVAVMLLGLVRHRSEDPTTPALDERGGRWILWGGTVMPVLVLASVTAVAVHAMRVPPRRAPVATIRVTGHQWWWQFDYEVDGQPPLRTANELHVPIGQPVRLLLTSNDVIHSFWVPPLEGKMDAIPGDTNELFLDVRQGGRYSGACAEYCGTQHAHMAIDVVAEDSAAFASWLGAQRSDARGPADSVSAHGERLFLASACAACHTIRGTSAQGVAGPDLTHIGSRATIAAGTRPNTLGNLQGWIANPQALKPGAAMPRLPDYTGPELRALATYVANLR